MYKILVYIIFVLSRSIQQKGFKMQETIPGTQANNTWSKGVLTPEFYFTRTLKGREMLNSVVRKLENLKKNGRKLPDISSLIGFNWNGNELASKSYLEFIKKVWGEIE